MLFSAYSLIVLARVIISWVQLPPHHPVVQFLHMATEPLLAPIRQIMPDTGGLDFSPIILLVLLRMLSGIV